MSIDWMSIISTVSGAVVGGGIGWLVFFRQSKTGATADAISKSGEAMEKILENIRQQQEVFNAMIAQKDGVIKQQGDLINEYREALDNANQKIKDFEYIIKNNTRKIEGMQKIIDNEMLNRKTAENDICFIKDCTMREPKRGTYKGA